MRNLTILREKSFVACLAKMKVYIEDSAAELTIGGTPCRMLGTLKNGEQKTFSVEEDARRIYVIADTVSKEYCNEVYELPAGTEDIALSGRNCYEPSRGNAFRFADNNSEAALQQRKRGKKIGWLVLIGAVLVGFVIGLAISLFGSGSAKPKTFTNEGISMTLTSDFVPVEAEGFLLCYSTPETAAFVVKEPFSAYAELETFSLDRYTGLVISTNQLDSQLGHTASGIPYYDYQGTDGSATIAFRAYTYRTEDAFWIVQFGTDADKIEAMYAQFDAWADTVTFTDGQ